MSLRPSNLPKLAVCASYVSNALFRARMQCDLNQAEMFYQPSADDLAAVEWAVNTLRVLVADAVVLTREDDCRVFIPGFENPGTADALILDKLAHADLKTGAMRNYREQMAAYALGLMEAHFASEWTAHLLFCDQRELVTIHFTYAEAKAAVEKVIAAYHNPQKKPTPCEYCGWCAKAETCEARVALADKSLAVAAPSFDFDAVLGDNGKLSLFLAGCAVLDDFREKAEETAKEQLQSGVDVPGWKLSTRRGPEFVDTATPVKRLSLWRASRPPSHFKKKSTKHHIWTAVGQQLALLLFLLISAVGQASLFNAAPASINVLTLLGAAYLAWVGLRLLFTAFRKHTDAEESVETAPARQAIPSTPGGKVLHGFFVNASNPKALLALFVITPRFIDPARSLPFQYCLIAVSMVVIDLVVMSGYTAVGSRILRSLQGDLWRRRIDGFFGCLFLIAATLVAKI